MNIQKGLAKRNKKKKILVALSGGVDSAVTAIKMKTRFSSVKGAFLDFFGEKNSLQRVKKIADKIGIELTVIDLRKEFKNDVVNYYLKYYQKGFTPNPCVVCNRRIKFNYLIKEVQGLGDRLVATGHYAKIKQINGQYYLCRTQSNKQQDQSYFLWQLKRQWLEKILFPLSNLNKKQVVEFARQKGILKYCQQPSQEFCFLGQIKNRYFANIQKILSFSEWQLFELETDRQLGCCQGNFFTLGQRKGFGLGGGPWYLIKINYQQKKLFLTKNKQKLFVQKFLVHQLNWLIEPPTIFPLIVRVKIRSTARLSEAKIKKVNGCSLEVEMSKPQLIAPSGQSAVFYQGEKVIGGGIIKQTH